MTALEWAGIAVAVATIVGSFAASVRWLVKHFLYELRPNGGQSVKDQVNALQVKVDLIYDLIIAKRK
jgi:hypothetical protein